MAKFDLEKYWDFRVWVKSQIAQLRKTISEYQQNGGGGGTGGGGDFNPNGTYPNMSVGTATKATSATTADKAIKDGDGKNIAENYALISDTVGKLGVLNSPADRSAAIPNALTNAWGIDNTLFSVIIYERANSSAVWVEKWNYANASAVQKTQVERGESTSSLFTSTRGYQVKVVVSTTTSNYIKALSLNIKTKDGTYSGDVDYTAYYGSSSTVAHNGSLGTWGSNWGASLLETAAQNVEYIFNANSANASIVIRGYRICTNEPTNPTLIGKALNAYEATTAVNISDAPVLTATEDEHITVKVGNKTSNALTVPYAQRADFATDLSGRVEATPEVFTYRPSAGDKSIKDDSAFIRRVKGNSVVFNQVAKEINSTHWGVYNSNNASISFNSNIATVTVTNYASNIYGYHIGARLISTVPTVPNHKYLIAVEVKSDTATIFGLELNSKYTELGFVTNEWTYCANIETSNRTVTALNIAPRTPFTAELNTYSFRNLICIDLTAMFGTGNEPTAEEFRALYPNSYYTYNAGELLNLVCSGIKTVGFNEFNGTYAQVLPNESYYLGGSYTSIGFAKELGGATETISIPSNRIYTPTQLGYIYASGTDICINLHHTGYRDGEYEPYKEVTHELPLDVITNGEPLRKAGSVYDEINETEYIKRVGVRGYATGDKDDATLLTDGRYTNYPLDEPIVTPIETPVNFNYYVEDFGTEEAILAENSAPFSADIIYQFNATDQVRNNTRNIQRLKKTAFNPSGSTTQYIRGDGSYGDVTELSRVTPINNGEYETPDDEEYDRRFTLLSHFYAKSPVELDDSNTVVVDVIEASSSSVLAEYWFEFAVGETLPVIQYNAPNNSDAVFIINGDMITDAVNILHLISSDGGITFYGEITNYSI